MKLTPAQVTAFQREGYVSPLGRIAPAEFELPNDARGVAQP